MAIGRARPGDGGHRPTAAGLRLRATGSIVAFDGFLKLYREDQDDAAEEDEGRMLPPMAERDPLRRGDVTASQHFTQPPPRYSEASLVKKLEELGIGRPSTYASILSVLQDRKYVRLEKRRFIPEDRGRLVTAFLVSFFEHYVDTDFTAELEEQLDDISGGRVDWRAVMHAFWDDFSRAVEQTKDLKISDVIDALDRGPGPAFLPRARGRRPTRALCPACGDGAAGAEARPVRQLHRLLELSGLPVHPPPRGRERRGGRRDPEGRDARARPAPRQRARMVTVRRGPYGLYVQQGEAAEDKKAPKPRAHVADPGDGRRHDDAGAGGRRCCRCRA